MTTDLKTKYAGILIRPRVTEKASGLSERQVYTFEVSPDATKYSIAKAIKVYFDVTPAKVAIVKNPSKAVIVRGKRGVKSGVKKAYVYLKKGDNINLS